MLYMRLGSIELCWPFWACKAESSNLPRWLFQASDSNSQNGMQILFQRSVIEKVALGIHFEDEKTGT